MNYDEQLAEVAGYADKAPVAEQGSAAWLQQRVGHCTASRFKDARDFTKGGKSSAKREGYKMEVLVERLTGSAFEHFVSAAMIHGTETEPLARMAYEAATGAMVEQVSFIHHPKIKWIGGSPDGLIGEDGGVEFKCPQPPEHIRILMTEELDDYLPQVQGLMWITGRQWFDFVSYCPMLPNGLQLYTKRIARDESFIKQLADEVQQFLLEVDELHQKLLERSDGFIYKR